MLFTSVFTAILAAANFAAATPVHSDGGIIHTMQARQAMWQDPTCVQGLITPFNKTDLEAMRSWFDNQSPDGNDFIGSRGWFTWSLGSTRVSAKAFQERNRWVRESVVDTLQVCIYNTNPNGTKDETVSHKAHSQCLEQVRDTCCSPTTDQW